MKRALFVATALYFSLVSFAYGLGGLPHENAARSISSEEKPFGREGDPKRVTRTINLDVQDAVHFSPVELNIKAGETVRFEVKNSGKTMHEMVLGRIEDLKNVQLKRKLPGVQEDEPYTAQVAPGKSNRLVWQFTKPGELHYACLAPGHFGATGLGKIVVR